MKRLFCHLLLGFCAVAAGAAQAQTRHVIVNGERLSDGQIAYLDRAQCTRIPNGYYWLNSITGAWGYAGNPAVQGYLGDLCRRQQGRSLSERGRLYNPGEIINGRNY